VGDRGHCSCGCTVERLAVLGAVSLACQGIFGAITSSAKRNLKSRRLQRVVARPRWVSCCSQHSGTPLSATLGSDRPVAAEQEGEGVSCAVGTLKLKVHFVPYGTAEGLEGHMGHSTQKSRPSDEHRTSGKGRRSFSTGCQSLRDHLTCPSRAVKTIENNAMIRFIALEGHCYRQHCTPQGASARFKEMGHTSPNPYPGSSRV
jgi:hypothetical protein